MAAALEFAVWPVAAGPGQANQISGVCCSYGAMRTVVSPRWLRHDGPTARKYWPGTPVLCRRFYGRRGELATEALPSADLRVVENLVTALVERGVIRITDLPEEARLHQATTPPYRHKAKSRPKNDPGRMSSLTR